MQFQRLGHHGDHQRLADRLTGADRQRHVLISLIEEGAGDESFARKPLDHGKHRRVGHARPPELHDQADLSRVDAQANTVLRVSSVGVCVRSRNRGVMAIPLSITTPISVSGSVSASPRSVPIQK